MIRNNNNNNNNEREITMTFKLDNNDKTRVMDLMNKLHDNGIDVWVKLNMNDMSDCAWRFIDSPSPHVFGTMAHPLVHGGVGALLNDLRTACINHGIIKKPVRMGTRNHMRLSCDANGKQWTTANGG